MITPGEIEPGQWFTLREKRTEEDDAQAAKWGALGVSISTGPEQQYSTTSLFCVEVASYPLIWVRLLDGRRSLIDVTGYDICEVKPELLQAVQSYVQSGGAPSQTAFDELCGKHNQLAKEVTDGLRQIQADVAKAIAATPKLPAKSLRHHLLELAYWAALAAVLIYAAFTR